MEIYREPTDYQAVGRDVIYGVTGADPAKTVEVEVRAGNDRKTVGIKRFRGQNEYLVNVAGYLRGSVEVKPVSIGRSGITTAGSRCIAAGIAVGNIASRETVLAAGTKDVSLFRRLSDAPARTPIAPGECDEIAWIAPQSNAAVQITLEADAGTDLEIALESIVCGDGMTILLIDTDDLAQRTAQAGRAWADFSAMRVSVLLGDETAFYQQYTLQKSRSEAVRLCWVNEYGAVDYHTFVCCAEERFDVEKNRMEGPQGIEIISSQAETKIALISEYEPRAVMRWLAGAAAAPNVWIARGNAFEPVDVITGEVVVHDAEALSRLEIAIRPTRKTKF